MGSINGTWGKWEVTRLLSALSEALVFTGSYPKDHKPILNSQEVPEFMTCHILKMSRENLGQA